MHDAYQYVRDHQEKKRKAGICRDCTEPATHGIFCQAHREKYDAATRETRDARKAQGVCILCGGNLGRNSSNYCNTHAEYFRKRQELADVAIFGALAKILGKRRVNKEKLLDVKRALKEITNHSDLVLDERQQIILDFRILSEYPESQEQIAVRFGGMSRQRVQQIESPLNKKLFNYVKNKGYLAKLRAMI